MRVVLLTLLLSTAVLAPRARAEQYRLAPEPAWVTKIVAPGRPIPSPTASGDVYEHLTDIQSNRAIDPPEAFYHFSSQAVNELGVPAISQIVAGFNPAYETLLLHKATIHRAGKDIPVPIQGHVKVLHREERLVDQIYDGELTAVLLVEDVRPGDIVEWSYTLRGANPVLAGHYATQWLTESPFSVGLMHRRLLWPASRPPLRVLRGRANAAPTVTRRGDVVEYALLMRDLKAIDLEPGVPGWYDATRSIFFTDMTSWEEVARWGTTLFQAPATLSPALQARVAAFRKGATLPEESAMAAVRFVQDEIRYLGIEIGENSHRATAPDVVLARRFGDCKDKALLLVTFLRALGFEAQPALVNTFRRDSVGVTGAAATAFDHVIVRTRSHGKTYWIDATNTGQRGDAFARIPPPRFGAALVLTDSTRGLSRIVPDNTLALTTIDKKIEAPNMDEPATLAVRTDYFGDEASAARVRVRSTGREALEKAYLDFYRRTYPKIVALAPVEVDDDEDLNRVRITERYSIPEFWKKGADGKATRGDVSAIELVNEIPTWRGETRRMPLRLSAPHRTVYTASIELPAEWIDEAEHHAVETPAVRLASRTTPHAKGFTTYHEFVTLRDWMTAEEASAAVPKFLAMENAIAGEIGSEAPATGGGAAAPDALAWMMAAMAGGLALLFSVMVYRAPAPEGIWVRTAYAPTSTAWNPGQPIGGWLYLFGLGILLSPFMALYNLWTSLASSGRIAQLGLTGADAKFQIVALVSTALASAWFVYTIVLLVLFLQRRRIFFRAYVGGVMFALVMAVVDIVGVQVVSPNDPDVAGQIGGLIRTLTSFGIWATYFVKSRRVEATFVR
jgi:transglutaminase-like putative cysteine protease